MSPKIKKLLDELSNHPLKIIRENERLPSLEEKSEILEQISDCIVKNREKISPLYRYSSANDWNIDSLERQKLVLRPASEMNDIFEGDIVAAPSFADMREKIKDFQKGTYLKSLSEKELDLQMFAHYGDDFKGMCVEYDFTHCIRNQIKDLFPVVYAEKPFESVKPESLKNNRFFFLRKAKAWEYESEWRFIRVVEDETKQKQEQSVDVRGCIKTIYLGPRMEDAKKEHIKEIAKRINAQVKEVSLSKKRFALKEKGENNEHPNLR